MRARKPGAAVSAKRLAEAGSQLSRELLEATLDLVPAPIVLVEPAGAEVRFANRAADELAGGEFPRGATAGRHPWTDERGEPVADDELPTVRAARGEPIDGLRLDWHLPAGVRSLLIFAEAIPRAAAHDPVVVLVFEDVTRLARAEAQAREARLRAEEAEHRASFLSRATAELSASLDYETTLRTVASLAVPERADWCLIDIIEPDDHSVRRLAIAHADPDKERFGWELAERYPPRLDEPALATLMLAGEAVVYPDIDDTLLRAVARDDEHLAILRELGFAGGIVAPLKLHGQVIGAISFIFAGPRRTAGRLDLELAEELAQRAAVALDNARLYQERTRVAETLQRSLLPPRLPRIEGFQLAARYRAAGRANDVGGDFYDVFPSAGSSWIVVLGDVAGKGADAAALTALARYTVRAAAVADSSPRHALAGIDAAMARDAELQRSGERFMTAVSACLDLDADPPALLVGCAGHPPPVVLRAGGTIEVLERTGRALGIGGPPEVGEQRLELAPGDAIALYTDGVTHAGAPDRPLGVDGLAAALDPVAGEPAAAIADAIERAAVERSGGTPRDDIAVVVLRRDA